MGRDQVFEKLTRHRDELSSLGVHRLGLFGSHARGGARPDSDLDFLVSFEPGAKTFDNFMDLRFLLQDLFGRPIDLVLEGNVKEQLREPIARDTVYVP